MTISVDDALVEVGDFGLFQWLILLGVCLVQMAVTYQVLLLSFIIIEPKWSCVNGSTICNLTGSFSVGDDNYSARCDMPRSEWFFHDDFTSIVTEFDLVCGDSILATVSTTLIFVGAIISGLICGYVSDRFGRKVVMLYVIINISMVPLVGAFANSLWLFTIFRFVVGTGVGGSTSVFIILIEFTSAKHRGNIGLMFWFSWTLASMLLPLYAFFVRDWSHLVILTSALGLPCFIEWWFFPECVRWYLIKGKIEQAEKELRLIARCNRKPMITEKLNSPEEEQKSSYFDLFATPEMKKVTLLCCIIAMVNSAVYSGVSISSAITLGGNMYLNFFIAATVEIPANLIALAFLNRAGRKVCVILGMIIASVMSIAAVVCQIFEKEQEVTDGFWMARLLFSMIAKLAITISFNCHWVWTNELFPTVVRNTGMGLIYGFAGIGYFSAGYIVWLARIHVLIPYAVFGTLAFLAGIACWFLPETTNRPTQETIGAELQVECEEKGKDNPAMLEDAEMTKL